MAYRVPGGQTLPSLNLIEPPAPARTSSGELPSVTPSPVDDNVGRAPEKKCFRGEVIR